MGGGDVIFRGCEGACFPGHVDDLWKEQDLRRGSPIPRRGRKRKTLLGGSK